VSGVRKLLSLGSRCLQVEAAGALCQHKAKFQHRMMLICTTNGT